MIRLSSGLEANIRLNKQRLRGGGGGAVGGRGKKITPKRGGGGGGGGRSVCVQGKKITPNSDLFCDFCAVRKNNR